MLILPDHFGNEEMLFSPVISTPEQQGEIERWLAIFHPTYPSILCAFTYRECRENPLLRIQVHHDEDHGLTLVSLVPTALIFWYRIFCFIEFERCLRQKQAKSRELSLNGDDFYFLRNPFEGCIAEKLESSSDARLRSINYGFILEALGLRFLSYGIPFGSYWTKLFFDKAFGSAYLRQVKNKLHWAAYECFNTITERLMSQEKRLCERAPEVPKGVINVLPLCSHRRWEALSGIFEPVFQDLSWADNLQTVEKVVFELLRAGLQAWDMLTDRDNLLVAAEMYLANRDKVFSRLDELFTNVTIALAEAHKKARGSFLIGVASNMAGVLLFCFRYEVGQYVVERNFSDGKSIIPTVIAEKLAKKENCAQSAKIKRRATKTAISTHTHIADLLEAHDAIGLFYPPCFSSSGEHMHTVFNKNSSLKKLGRYPLGFGPSIWIRFMMICSIMDWLVTGPPLVCPVFRLIQKTGIALGGLQHVCGGKEPNPLLCVCSSNVLETFVYDKTRCAFWGVLWAIFNGFEKVRPKQH